MQQNGRQAAGTARKIGGGGPLAGGVPAFRVAPARGWLLKVWAVLFGWPLFLAMVRGSFQGHSGTRLGRGAALARRQPDRPG